MPQKLSREEIREQLFNGLMELIEPKLCTYNRKETAHELAEMEDEERDAWLKYFEGAFIEFTEQWPEYVARAVEAVHQLSDEMTSVSKASDASAITSMEKQLDDASTDAA